MKHLLFLLSLYCSATLVWSKNVLSDKETSSNIKKGLDHAYNYEFRAAEKYFEKVRIKFPNSSVFYLLEAIKMNLEYPELIADESELYKKFHAYIKTTILFADKILKDNPNDLENIFFKMTAMSLAGLKHSQAKQYSKAMNIAKSTYEYVKKAMKYKEQFHEFYFTSGLYNYYSVQYPESHPIIKPLMVFFQNGDKQLGIKELEYAAKNTAFSEAEAYGFLANVYFKYEFNFEKAYEYAYTLHGKFPKNSFYQYKLCEIALMKKEIKVSKACIDSIKFNKAHFYQGAYHILYANYLELNNGQTGKIRTLYTEGLSILQKNNINSAELNSIAYMGLARCFVAEKNIQKAKYYYKLAIDNSSNKYYEKEAYEYLRKN